MTNREGDKCIVRHEKHFAQSIKVVNLMFMHVV